MQNCRLPRLSLALTLLLVFAVNAGAQTRPGGNGGRPTPGTGNTGNTPTITRPNNLPSITTQPRLMFLSGKVRLEDGSPLTDQAIIETICRGQRHAVAYTDRKGNFSFEFGQRHSPMAEDIGPGEANISGGPTGPVSGNRSEVEGRMWRECELEAVLPGFTSQVIELGRFDGSGATDVGTIVLHRMGEAQGLTVSATTAQAPSGARKAFEKGQEDAKKAKWDAAEEKFQKAVQIYPKFAIAWVDLGRVQMQKKDNDAARQSFGRAAEADPKLVSPYQELARIAFAEKNWQEVVTQTDHVLALNPVSFPQDWFLNSVGNFYLEKLDAAEKSARQGIKTDVERRIPKMEFVLGVILAQKHDYPGALEHLRTYVRLAPNAPDVVNANNQIAQMEKITGTATAAPK